MSYISKIFERANLQQIRGFLQNGAPLLELSDQTYEQRMNEGIKMALRILHSQSSNNEETENQLIAAVSDHGDACMELGLQLGVILAAQLLNHN